jgi:hypothetical protein
VATNEREDAGFHDYLVEQIAAKDAEIARLKDEIAKLKKQKGISSPRESLTFNEHTGLWADQGGLLYCSTCLDQDKRNPMKSELPHGWRCSAVPKHYFSNPDSPAPRVVWGSRRGRI